MHTKNKKIIFFIANFKPGGAEAVTINIANEIAHVGYQCILLVLNTDGPFASRVSKDVKVVSLGARRAIYALPKLILYLRETNPDIIFSSLDHINFLVIAAKFIGSIKTRVFVTEHSTASYAVLSSFTDKFISKFKGLFYNYAEGVICVSNGSAKDLEENFRVKKSKLHVIYNPVITNNFFLDINAFKIKKVRTVPFRYLMSAGRLVYNKDFHTLITAFAQSKIPDDVHLVIIGEGDDRFSLEQLINNLSINDRVHLVGHVDNPIEWMLCSDFFVLSSRFEGLPTVLIEALGCNKYVISTDCPSGPREILEDGKWGDLFEVGDVSRLCELIESFYRSEITLDVSSRAHSFTTSIAVEKYKKIIESRIYV